MEDKKIPKIKSGSSKKKIKIILALIGFVIFCFNYYLNFSGQKTVIDNQTAQKNVNVNSDPDPGLTSNTNVNSSLAKDPDWHPTITPYYAEENSNTNISKKDYKSCVGQKSCTVKIKAVIDGDTIDLVTGERVRYIGVDTPETKHPVKKVQCFGKEASEKNKELVLGKEVRLEKDVSDKDRYGRLLRYVYLPAGQVGVGDLFINEFLARNGFAHAVTFPPDVKFSNLFLEAEREARENHRGLWAPGVCP